MHIVLMGSALMLLMIGIVSVTIILILISLGLSWWDDHTHHSH